VPRTQLLNSCLIGRSARTAQVEGMFDVAYMAEHRFEMDVDLPIEGREWNIGLIVGPSGSGKSTIARQMFPDAYVDGFRWPNVSSILDAFPARMDTSEITGLLSSVGLSSPPSWMRPFKALSNGEQFRVTLALALAKSSFVVMDEFTSVVDRNVAQIGSAAAARAIRQRGAKFIGVTCHYDVEEWLQPDWTYDVAMREFTWRALWRRPDIRLAITRATSEAWRLFAPHHYLSAHIHASARCFVAWRDDHPVAFVAVMNQMGRTNTWREHRCVCLPDYQGVGIGMRVSTTVAGMVKHWTGGDYRSITSHPTFIAARARNPNWKCVIAPTIGRNHSMRHRPKAIAPRMTATFRYVGPPIQAPRELWDRA
jgi:ABC-type molybdenum transport system ATPase subunit/photorepair protein PhrA